MKARMKSKSRRQWIVGGVVLLGGLSLLTVGFATWIIGTNITSNYGKANVTVQTATRESILLEATLSDSQIAISESGVSSDSNHIYTDANAAATDFEISFSELQVTVSSDYVTEHKVIGMSLTVSLAYSADEIDDPTTATSETSSGSSAYMTESGNTYAVGDSDCFALSGDNGGRSLTNGTGTFVDLATQSIELAHGSLDKAGNYIYYPSRLSAAPTASTNYSLTLLKWGTLFAEKSPCTFYNGVSGISWDTDLTPSAQVEKELDAMCSAWTGKTLGVKLTVKTTTSE